LREDLPAMDEVRDSEGHGTWVVYSRGAMRDAEREAGRTRSSTDGVGSCFPTLAELGWGTLGCAD
jgi:hypothetical protein